MLAMAVVQEFSAHRHSSDHIIFLFAVIRDPLEAYQNSYVQ